MLQNFKLNKQVLNKDCLEQIKFYKLGVTQKCLKRLPKNLKILSFQKKKKVKKIVELKKKKTGENKLIYSPQGTFEALIYKIISYEADAPKIYLQIEENPKGIKEKIVKLLKKNKDRLKRLKINPEEIKRLNKYENGQLEVIQDCLIRIQRFLKKEKGLKLDILEESKMKLKQTMSIMESVKLTILNLISYEKNADKVYHQIEENPKGIKERIFNLLKSDPEWTILLEKFKTDSQDSKLRTKVNTENMIQDCLINLQSDLKKLSPIEKVKKINEFNNKFAQYTENKENKVNKSQSQIVQKLKKKNIDYRLNIGILSMSYSRNNYFINLNWFLTQKRLTYLSAGKGAKKCGPRRTHNKIMALVKMFIKKLYKFKIKYLIINVLMQETNKFLSLFFKYLAERTTIMCLGKWQILEKTHNGMRLKKKRRI